MDYEKKYKEALEKARKLYDDAKVLEYTQDMEDYETIFPELKESEDEVFRKYILKCCEETIYADDRGLELSMDTTKKLKNWLEKQCEQKPINDTDEDIVEAVSKTSILNMVEPKFKVGEIVERCKNSWYNEGKIAGQFEGISDDEKYQQGWHDALEKQSEHTLIKEIKRRKELYSQEKEKAVSSTEKISLGGRIAMLEELCAFIDVKQGEQKPTWSEDERMRMALVEYFDGMKKDGICANGVHPDKIIDWLKNKKDEQME